MWDRINKILLTVFVVLLIIAALVTIFPPLQAEAQWGGHCRWVTRYTCVWRRGQRVCGYFTYQVCSSSYRYRPYYRGR